MQNGDQRDAGPPELDGAVHGERHHHEAGGGNRVELFVRTRVEIRGLQFGFGVKPVGDGAVDERSERQRETADIEKRVTKHHFTSVCLGTP